MIRRFSGFTLHTLESLRGAPITRVGRILARRGFDPNEVKALDVFAGRGDQVAPLHLRNLELWEKDPDFERSLASRFPSACVKCVNSFDQIKLAVNRYGLILADNWPWPYEGHCEHFDIFDDIVRACSTRANIITNVVPRGSKMKEYPTFFGKDHLDRRREFYETSHPENVSFPEMIEKYKRLLAQNGFSLEWHSFVRRGSMVYFMILGLLLQS